MCSICLKLLAYLAVWGGLASYRADGIAYLALLALFLWDGFAWFRGRDQRARLDEAEERVKKAGQGLVDGLRADALGDFLLRRCAEDEDAAASLALLRKLGEGADGREPLVKELGFKAPSKARRRLDALRRLNELARADALPRSLHGALQEELRGELLAMGMKSKTVDEASWFPAEEIEWIGDDESAPPVRPEAEEDLAAADEKVRLEKEAALAAADEKHRLEKEAALAAADEKHRREKDAVLAAADGTVSTEEAPVGRAPEEPASLFQSVVEAFMEEGNVKWVEVLASAFYLVAFVIGVVLLISRWGEISPFWRYGALLGLILAVGGGGRMADSFLGLDGTARALAAVTAMLVPMNFLVMGLLFRPAGRLVVSTGSFLLALVVATGLLGWLHRGGVRTLMGRPVDGQVLVALAMGLPALWLDCPLPLVVMGALTFGGLALSGCTGPHEEADDEAIRFWRRFFVSATGAWSLVVVTLAWALGPAGGEGLHGAALLFLLALFGLHLAMGHRRAERARAEGERPPWLRAFEDGVPDTRCVRLSIGSLSLLGLAMLLAWNGGGRGLAVQGAVHLAGALVLGLWAVVTALPALGWVGAVLVAAGGHALAGSFLVLDLHAALVATFLVFATGLVWRGLRERLFADGRGDALALPHFVVGAVLAVLLSIASVADPAPGRLVTAVLALGLAGALAATRLRVLLWPLLVETSLCLGLVAGRGLLSTEDRLLVLLAWILPAVGLLMEGMGSLLGERCASLRDLPVLKGRDGRDAFSDVAAVLLGLALVVFLVQVPAAGRPSFLHVGDNPLARHLPLAAALGMAAAALRGRKEHGTGWGVFFVAFAAFLCFGPLRPWAWTVSALFLRWLVVAWAVLFLLVRLRDLRGGGLVPAAFLLALAPMTRLLPLPFLDRAAGASTGELCLSALLAAAVAWEGRRLGRKAWWALPLAVLFGAIAVDGALRATGEAALRLMGLSCLVLLLASFCRWPRLRLALGREGRRQGEPGLGREKPHGLVVATVLIGLPVLCGLLLPALQMRLFGGDCCLETAFFGPAMRRAPFVAPLLVAGSALASAAFLVARFVAGASLIRGGASLLLAVVFAGQVPRLFHEPWAAWSHMPLLVLLALALQRRSRGGALLVALWALVLAITPWWFWHRTPASTFIVTGRLVTFALAFWFFFRRAEIGRGLFDGWLAVLASVGLGSWIATAMENVLRQPLPYYALGAFLRVEARGLLVALALLVFLLRRRGTFPLVVLRWADLFLVALVVATSLGAELCRGWGWGGAPFWGSGETVFVLALLAALQLATLSSEGTTQGHRLLGVIVWLLGLAAVHVGACRLGLPLVDRPLAFFAAAAAVAALSARVWDMLARRGADPKQGPSRFFPRPDALALMAGEWARAALIFLPVLFGLVCLVHLPGTREPALFAGLAVVVAALAAPLAPGRWGQVFVGATDWAAAAVAASLRLGFPSGKLPAGFGPEAGLAASFALAGCAALWQHLARRARTEEGRAGTPFLGLEEGELDLAFQATRFLALVGAFSLLPLFAGAAIALRTVVATALLALLFAWSGRLSSSRFVGAGLVVAASIAGLHLLWFGAGLVSESCSPWSPDGPGRRAAFGLAAAFLALSAWGWARLGRHLRGREEAGEGMLPAVVASRAADVVPFVALLAAGLTLDGPRGPAAWLPAVLAIAATVIHFFHEAWKERSEARVYVGLASGAALYGYLKAAQLIGHGFWGQLGLAVGAFVLLGLAHRAQGGSLGVFRRPFENAAMILPLVLVARTGLGFGAPIRWLGAPGLERFGLMAMAAAFYGLVGRRRRWASVLSLVLANFALAILFHHQFRWTDASRHLDAYLIPAGLSLVLFSRLHREWVGEQGRRGLRVLGLLVVYGAPTWHCLAGARLEEVYVLMTLGALGFLAGLGLRVRHFFLFGLLFMAVALGTLLLRVWHLQVTSFTFFFFLVLALGFFTHAALLRKWREGYRALLDDFAAWD